MLVNTRNALNTQIVYISENKAEEDLVKQEAAIAERQLVSTILKSRRNSEYKKSRIDS